MIVIPPIPITSSVLASSTVAEPSAGEVVWNAATSYAVGDVVIRTTTHRKYECQIAGVGGNGGNGAFVYFTYAGGLYGIGRDVYNVASGGLGQGFVGSATVPSAQTSGETGGYYEYPGAVFGGDTRPWARGGSGGVGGAWGQPGVAGGFGDVGGSFDSAYSDPYPSGGGNPGNSVRGNSFITWLATGTRLGPISA